MTLEEAKLCLRIDQDMEDDRIRALIAAGEVYIEESTGLTADRQDAEPLCDVAMEFLIKHWYSPLAEINFYSERALASLLKSIKAKYSSEGVDDEKDGAESL